MTDDLTDRWGDPVRDPFPADQWPAEVRERRPRRRGGRWVALVIVVLLGAAVVVAAPWDPLRRQAFADQWIVWTDPPPVPVSALAEQLGLTEDARRIFFATKPQIEQATEFQANCDLEAKIVLGCYFLGRIHVYAVTDSRLAGTIEATAAHELLHAVYERMSLRDTTRIDALVAQYVATLPADDPNLATVASYPAEQQASEWHSRLGTSYPQLPAELEAHYARVFTDRARVLAYDAQSTETLDGYANRIDELSAQLDAASADLTARSAAYDAEFASLSADIDVFNARADAGAFGSQEEFEAAREVLNERQERLEATRVSLNADVDAYNAKVAELSSLDAERAELYSHLDSHSAP